MPDHKQPNPSPLPITEKTTNKAEDGPDWVELGYYLHGVVRHNKICRYYLVKTSAYDFNLPNQQLSRLSV